MHPLNSLFRPHVIAVIGASDRYGSTGRVVFGQLLAHRVAEQVIPINSQHKMVGGVKAYANLTELAEECVADTAVVVVAADKMPNIVREASKTAIKNIILINELEQTTPQIRAKLDKAAEWAQKANIRLLAVTVGGLDGLFRQEGGSCAYIGQSAGIADCLLNYAQSRGMRFSRFITLNPQSNQTVSTGQIVDFVAAEAETEALLVHISTLDNTCDLLSALRAASRKKSVFVLSTLPESEEELLFQQALARNKIFTVATLSEFLTIAKLLHTGVEVSGRRLGMISNTPQISALSLKVLPQMGLQLANTSHSTLKALGKCLPHKLPVVNPLYLSADTAPTLFQTATELFLQDENIDAVCVIYVGSNVAESRCVAQMVGTLQARYPRKALLMTWLGSADNEDTRLLFHQQKNLHFRQPEHALNALEQLNRYRDYHQTRHYTTSFYDYRAAAQTAQRLRERLPQIIDPESKIHPSQFVNVLDNLQKHFRSQPQQEAAISTEWFRPIFNAIQVNLPFNHDTATSETDCAFSWDIHHTFGQMLTLRKGEQTAMMLPPLTPDTVNQALHDLDLPPWVWQNWLLETVDVLCRLPEIQLLRVKLSHHAKQGFTGFAPEVKLNHQATIHHHTFTPYPYDYEEIVLIKNAKLSLRPIRPEDADLIKKHIALMSDESREMRFMSKSKELPPSLLAKLTQMDYAREFALLLHDADLRPIAMANYTADQCSQTCEFGISLLDEMQGKGIGRLLMERLIKRAKQQGFQTMRAEILANNHAMQQLAFKLGFVLSKHPHDGDLIEAYLNLK